jgi:choline dehydrogenase-like flavoprotein
LGLVGRIRTALCNALLTEWSRDASEAQTRAAGQFVSNQLSRLSGYLKRPMALVTLVFDTTALFRFGRRFHNLPPDKQRRHIAAWRNGKLGVQRDLIKVHESLVVFAFESAASANPRQGAASAPAPKRQKYVVIGSGPGGSVMAALLAEAGRDVLLIEEGPFLPLDSCQPFSLDEMVQKYRNGGLTVAMGKPKIAYVEGRCVGGGSEINSGLYHRTPPEILQQWRKDFGIYQMSDAELLPYFEANERDLHVTTMPGPAPLISRKLQEGADRLGWKCQEVPRWFDYDGTTDAAGSPLGLRRSMTRSFIPRALAAGCKIQSDTRIQAIVRRGECWTLQGRARGATFEMDADSVVLSCGAIHTPNLLLASGFSTNIGRTLQCHPTIKLAAEFDEEINTEIPGVGVHQVKQFSPDYSFGCSISSQAYLALSLQDHRISREELQKHRLNMGVYYSMIVGSGRGTVGRIPHFADPVVGYRLTDDDLRKLSDSLGQLGLLLLEAGAIRLFPSIVGSPVVHSKDDLSQIPQWLNRSSANLMTIHLFSSCPMGENRDRCAADSFGKVHGAPDLYICDASLLPTAPGVNPQGSIMAVARRNAMKILGTL